MKTETKEKSLLELRKEAQTLGITDYAKFSKDELKELIASKQAGVTVAHDPELIQSEEELQEEIEAIESGKAEVISTEEAATLGKVDKKAEKAAAKAAEKAEKEAEKEKIKEEKAAAKEAKAAEKAANQKEKKPKAEKTPKAKITFEYIPKGEKPEKLGETSSKVYDDLLIANDSLYQVSKRCNTYFSVVDKVVDKYFDVRKIDEKVSQETSTENAE